MKSIVAITAAGVFAAAIPSAYAIQGHEGHNHSADATQAGATVYKATGSVKEVNKAAGKVTISHQAIAELRWPAMTMRFGVSDRKLLDQLSAGQKVDFGFVQRGNEYVVTALY